MAIFPLWKFFETLKNLSLGNLPRVVAAISYYRYFIVSVCDLDWQFHCQKSLKFVIYCAVYRKAFRHIGGARNQRRLQNSFGLTLILKSRKTFLLSKVRVCVNPSAFIEHLCKFPFIWSSTSQLTEHWHLFFLSNPLCKHNFVEESKHFQFMNPPTKTLELWIA